MALSVNRLGEPGSLIRMGSEPSQPVTLMVHRAWRGTVAPSRRGTARHGIRQRLRACFAGLAKIGGTYQSEPEGTQLRVTRCKGLQLQLQVTQQPAYCSGSP